MESFRLRFESNLSRHRAIDWVLVRERLKVNPEKLRSSNEIEITGGEPDVVGLTRIRESSSSMTAHPRAPQGEEAFATIDRP
ncbi:MAG TPA: DUF4256 domain-containing protein [Mesotoga prima]|nr:DUF4256 domain-containing protein [Mesotoga prima]HQN61380.1 DUF4256 domain-containing protein [Mesotoga prima]HUM22640.1 DUF4256 domain-containing protein [Mesotoga prima]